MTLTVEASGPLLLVQDLGRTGSMHLGVPVSGALDPSEEHPTSTTSGTRIARSRRAIRPTLTSRTGPPFALRP